MVELRNFQCSAPGSRSCRSMQSAETRGRQRESPGCSLFFAVSCWFSFLAVYRRYTDHWRRIRRLKSRHMVFECPEAEMRFVVGHLADAANISVEGKLNLLGIFQ